MGEAGVVRLNGSQRRARRRQVLMKRDPHCAYCGCEVVYFDNHGGQLPPNFATIDHVYSRLTPGGRPRKGDTVLACRACNEARGHEEVAQLPIEELWERSGAYPRELAK